MDPKDILGLPKASFQSSLGKKSRPRKEPQRKSDGVSRELYALTGGVGMPPLMPTVEASHLKRRPAAQKEKVTWQWLPFTSSARTDNLQLYHWVRVVNSVQPTGDYQFAKCNKKVDVLRYTDEEYEKYLVDPAWSKEETDQLFDLCERFDLRFIVIADRFPTDHNVEDLKSRYYSATRCLLMHRAQSFEDVSGNPLVKDHYDAAHETERKRALSALLSQTKHQEKNDADTLAEAKRILESRAANKNADEAGMPSSSENAMVPVEGVSPLSGTQPPLTNPYAAANSSIPNSLRALRVYLRTHALDQMVQAASASAGLRIIKRVDQTLQDLGVHLKPKVSTKAVCVEHLELRNEILTLLNLQKQLQNKEVEVSANRESSFTEAPSTPKDLKIIAEAGVENHVAHFAVIIMRSNRDMDQTFVPDALGFTGERAGKQDHKWKSSTGRFLDAPPSPPQSKKPRKLKASD